MSEFKALVLGGGGLRGIITLGVLHYYGEQTKIDFDEIEEYAGTSIGAAISLLLVCGYTPYEIYENVRECFDELFDFGTINIVDFLKNFGLTSIEPFIATLSDLVKKKLGCVPSMKKLYDLTHKKLMISVTNLSTMKTDCYSHLTTPGISCVNAVKISCSLPIVFGRISYKGQQVTDGGLLNNLPYDFISPKHLGNSRVLCIATTGEDKTLPIGNENAIGYIFRLIMTPINYITEMRCNSIPETCDLLKIHHNGPSLPMGCTKDDTINMFLYGYEKAQEYNETIYLHIPISE
jgi:predicted acylesterase/phospholipase RssA